MISVILVPTADIVSNWIILLPNSEYIGSGANTYPPVDYNTEIVLAAMVRTNQGCFFSNDNPYKLRITILYFVHYILNKFFVLGTELQL